jgi:hypothetical protein
MNIDNIYTFQFVRPLNKVQNKPNELPETEVPETKVPTKTLVEGTLTSVCKDPDNQGRSIFSNCTVYNYYSDMTMPVVNTSQIYSIPTSWIMHSVEGGIEKWNH